MLSKTSNIVLQDRTGHWQIVISSLVSLLLLFSCPAFASSPRSIASALEIMEAEAKEKSAGEELKIGFIKATFSGVHIAYEVNFYTDEDFIHTKIGPDGEFSLTTRPIHSENMRDKWGAVSEMQAIPDLDLLLVEAESIVRRDGQFPTGLAMLKFNYYPATRPEQNDRNKTSIFFEVENSDKARVVQFEGKDFLSHRPGILVKIPVVRIPEVSMPKIKPVKLDLPEGTQQTVQSFTVNDNETLLRIEGDFLFDFDSYEPRPDANELVQSLVPVILEKKPTQVVVEGHTDSWGTPPYNDNLSTKRAEAIADLLVDSGVARSLVVVKGFGETRPAAVEMTQDGKDDPIGRQKNRRVEIRFR